MTDIANRAPKNRKPQQGRGVTRGSAAGEPPKKGGILAALRCSPLVGAGLDLARARGSDRGSTQLKAAAAPMKKVRR